MSRSSRFTGNSGLPVVRAFFDDVRECAIRYSGPSRAKARGYAGCSSERIRSAVDNLLGPLGRRVNSIVNYDRFQADDDVAEAYLDLVRYVEETYYLKVSRYTTSGFMRLKLGKELARRKVSSHVFESQAEARRHLNGDG